MSFPEICSNEHGNVSLNTVIQVNYSTLVKIWYYNYLLLR